MRGLVFLGERDLEIRDFPDPVPGPREVIVKMMASGMCGSDLKHYRMPKSERPPDKLVIGGHEPCGVVVERGQAVGDDEARIGQRVMIHHYSGCGRCKHCRVGYSQMCVEGYLSYGSTAHGGHADLMRVLPSMLLPLADELSYEEGAAIGCGTGTAYMALKRLGVSGRDTVAIFGQGPVGLSGTMLAKEMGARVIAVDLSEQRLALAREFGADFAINPRGLDPVGAIRELTHGEGAEATLDCTGSSEARVAAVKSAQDWGRVCFVGVGGSTAFDITADIIHKQLTIHGSWTFSSVGQEECARFILDHELPLKRLFTHHFKLDEAKPAYELFETQTTGKGMFVFE
jgi:threonine dehydrogenase-like Zn-dependent dehydrogenase